MDQLQIDREMIDYYEDRAETYDRVYENHEKGQLDEMGTYLGTQLAGRDVLEIACGTGFWTEQVARFAKSVFATDALDGPLAEAQKRLKNQSNVRLAKADAYTLEGINERFDGALHIQWYSHIPLERIAESLEILHARLIPGATVLLADNYLGEEDSPARKEKWENKYEFDERGNAHRIRKLPNGKEYRVLKNMPTLTDLTRQLKDHTTDLTFKTFPYFWVASYKTPGAERP